MSFEEEIVLAGELYGKGEYDEAVEAAQRALDAQKRSESDFYGDTHRLVVRCRVAAANKSRDRNTWKRALAAGEEAKTYFKEHEKEKTIDYINLLKDLASNYSNFGKAPEAVGAWHEVYALEKTLGLQTLDHATVTCKGLADAHIALKEYPNAFHFLNEAVRILEQEYGNKADEAFSVILMRCATCQFRCGEQSPAIETFDRGLKMFRDSGGKELSNAFASFLWSFQGMLMENKLYQRSIRVGEDALKVMQRIDKDTSGFYGDVMNRINFCKNKLDPSHPFVSEKKERREREEAEKKATCCGFCGVKAGRKIDEPIIEGAPEIKFKRCGRCKGVLYCSASCQKADWKTHKAACVAQTAK